MYIILLITWFLVSSLMSIPIFFIIYAMITSQTKLSPFAGSRVYGDRMEQQGWQRRGLMWVKKSDKTYVDSQGHIYRW